ncbi:MAG: CAP domain-containing protein [Pyrinomonadaceae bacterium]|nr:CAP domain-containing protein [Pyrinomonadaceae bacterium]MCX7639806.1 CAP domain-containing protein [Pyrinomonadaceae bacterium]MDW8304389.1 CAP domain-containing protein [Acidobacteriota bacterium]
MKWFLLFIFIVPSVYGQSQLFASQAFSLISSNAESISFIRATSVSKRVSFQDLEKRIFEMLNQRRAEIGLEPLVWNERLALAARLHSKQMAQYGFFSHVGLDGSLVSKRIEAFGVKGWRAVGENIAYNRGFDDPVSTACEGWMKSRGHRDNILSPRWKESAVGIAVATDGTYYFTQIFLEK